MMDKWAQIIRQTQMDHGHVGIEHIITQTHTVMV